MSALRGGGSWANSDGYYVDAASTISGGPTAFTGPLSTSLSSSGQTAGVYAGCDYQMNNWVIGFEGDWSALSQSSTGGPNPASAAFLNPLDFWTQQLDWFATLRARLGYTV